MKYPSLVEVKEVEDLIKEYDGELTKKKLYNKLSHKKWTMKVCEQCKQWEKMYNHTIEQYRNLQRFETKRVIKIKKEIKRRLMNKFSAKDEGWIRESIKEVLSGFYPKVKENGKKKLYWK